MTWRKWINVIRQVINNLVINIDPNSGNIVNCYFQHLPSCGGYYDQDEYIINLWEYIKNQYILELRGSIESKKTGINKNSLLK